MSPSSPIPWYGIAAASTLLALAIAASAGAVTAASQGFDIDASEISITASEDEIAVGPEELLRIDGLLPPTEASSPEDLEANRFEQMFVAAPEPATAITICLGLSLLAQQARRAGHMRRRQLDRELRAGEARLGA